MSFAPLVALGWAWAPGRRWAWLVMTSYFAMGARSVIGGAPAFFGEHPVLGWVVCLGAAGLLGVVFELVWSRDCRRSYRSMAWRWGLGLLIVAAPGIGVLGVVHPLAAAGAWFPGLGWAGLVAAVLVMSLIQTPRRVAVAVLVMAVGAIGLEGSEDRTEAEWVGVDTEVGHAASLGDFANQFDVASASMARAGRVRGRVKVLPESAAPLWSRSMQALWRDYGRGMAARGEEALVLGSVMPRGRGHGFENGAVILGPGGAEVGRYRQRVPVPLAMWVPWKDDTVHANWFGHGAVEVAGHRAGVLVCYEQGLVWPVLASILEGADVLVGIGNLFWFRGTNVEEVGTASLSGYARLFGLPVVRAINR